MCRLRPRRPMVRNSSANSGLDARSSENSSTTMNSAGSGSRGAPFARAASYSPTFA